MAFPPRINCGCAAFVTLLSLLLIGCERSIEPQDSPAETPVSEKANTAPPIIGNEELPAGHPPLEAPRPISASDPMPSDHPSIEGLEPPSAEKDDYSHPELSGSEIQIVVSEEVQAKWVAVLFGVTDGGEVREIRIQPGEAVTLERSGLALLVEAFLPSYSSDFNTITSVSNELDNPAAMVRLTKGDEVVAKGWVFQNLPEYNTFKHESVKLILQSAESAKSTMHHTEQP